MKTCIQELRKKHKLSQEELAAIIMARFFSQIIFLTLLSVLTFMSLVKGSLKIYYRNKF
ncbi:hypothetical protein [Clostridium sp. CF012]|uniref:hypothetical protein n=1 Tax=Clostridium sp. CF012 TaxID=2843319 RepID=UPI001C0C9E84|nr:hypothetical protein [Clostridium sp. CF012]MBU3142472.1 hypothetical protein [Clostridium sp. CF012]